MCKKLPTATILILFLFLGCAINPPYEVVLSNGQIKYVHGKYNAYKTHLREEIKIYAQKLYYDNNIQETGVVSVTFRVNPNGAVENVVVNSEKSTGSTALQEIVVKAIMESAPFMPLPPKYKIHPYIDFDVSLNFIYQPEN